MNTITGRCLCGGVTFEAQAEALETHACHCSECRRWSGAPAMGIGVASVNFSGEQNIARYESSKWALRGFCKTCGSNLFFQRKGFDFYVLWVGALDDPSAIKFTGEIFIDEKPDFYNFVGDHPRQTGAEFFKSIGVSAD